MREILFRGKRESDGKWIYGLYSDNYVHETDFPCIMPLRSERNDYDWEVIPETVGEYTGLEDKNGRRIFEGDIVKHYNHNPIKEYSEDIGRVFYYSKTCRFLRTSKLFPDDCLEIDGCCEYEIIGNIHDTPEVTDNEIIQALECCNKPVRENSCTECAFYRISGCSKNMINATLDLINRQREEIGRLAVKIYDFRKKCWGFKAEIEKLQKENYLLSENADTAFQDGLNEAQELYALQVEGEIKSDAIKEFAERLKEEIICDTAYGCDCNQHSGYYDYKIKIGDIPEYIDDIVKN